MLCQDERRARILEEHLQQHGGIAPSLDLQLNMLPESGGCAVTLGVLSAGMEYPTARLAVITKGSSSACFLRRKVKKLPSNRERLQSFTDLSPGDLVVHEHLGIGRYVVYSECVDGVEKDYVKISLCRTDSCTSPQQLVLVSKYIGGGEDARSSCRKWRRRLVPAKSKAKGAAKEMARELIALLRRETAPPGHAFAPDSVWQVEFEERFGYQRRTPRSAASKKSKRYGTRDPHGPLLCGDVGYGKTEVALRAVMKCVLDGYQAAILVPTTVWPSSTM